MSAINLNDVSQIPGDECLGDSRERINYNVDLLKEAIEELQGVAGLSPGGGTSIVGCLSADCISINSGAVEFTGATQTPTAVTATNTYIEVKIGGALKYLRLYDI